MDDEQEFYKFHVKEFDPAKMGYKYKIELVGEHLYPEVVEVWEASVRATHDFLNEDDIEYFKPLILNEFLKSVELRCVKNEEGKIVGFIGVKDQKVEMLFIHPEVRRQGVGKFLLNYAIDKFKVTKVDVNEDNKQAVDFYKYFGFETVSRSEFDPTGKPYPILHMKLNQI